MLTSYVKRWSVPTRTAWLHLRHPQERRSKMPPAARRRWPAALQRSRSPPLSPPTSDRLPLLAASRRARHRRPSKPPDSLRRAARRIELPHRRGRTPAAVDHRLGRAALPGGQPSHPPRPADAAGRPERSAPRRHAAQRLSRRSAALHPTGSGGGGSSWCGDGTRAPTRLVRTLGQPYLPPCRRRRPRLGRSCGRCGTTRRGPR